MAKENITLQMLTPKSNYYFVYLNQKGEGGEITITESKRKNNFDNKSRVSIDGDKLDVFIEHLNTIRSQLRNTSDGKETPKIRIIPTKAYMVWTEGEEILLEKLVKEGKAMNEISEILEREIPQISYSTDLLLFTNQVPKLKFSRVDYMGLLFHDLKVTLA